MHNWLWRRIRKNEQLQSPIKGTMRHSQRRAGPQVQTHARVLLKTEKYRRLRSFARTQVRKIGHQRSVSLMHAYVFPRPANCFRCLIRPQAARAVDATLLQQSIASSLPSSFHFSPGLWHSSPAPALALRRPWSVSPRRTSSSR